jgi:protein arginine kinase activator
MVVAQVWPKLQSVKCDHCDNEATVHEVTVKSGVKIEKHLCESCASSQGLATGAGSTPISEMIKHYVLTHGMTTQPQQPTAPGPGGAVKAQTCPTCKTTFSEFRQHGLLGCPDCYKVFEAQLSPLLERAHDGGVKHLGKTPRRALGGGHAAPPPVTKPASVLDLEDREARLRRIRKELDSAVQAEKYELAAKLRDEIRKISEMGPGKPPSLS